MNAVQRRDIIHAIETRQAGIDAFEKKAFELGCQWSAEARLQGADLLRIQAECRQTEWRDLFVKGEIKSLSLNKADHYVRHATSTREEPENVRQLYLDITMPEPRGDDQPKQLKPHTEAFGKFMNFQSFERKHPFETWPQLAQDELRNQCLPFALKLWPDKFATHQPGHD